jgi:hypothetical protein
MLIDYLIPHMVIGIPDGTTSGIRFVKASECRFAESDNPKNPGPRSSKKLKQLRKSNIIVGPQIKQPREESKQASIERVAPIIRE